MSDWAICEVCNKEVDQFVVLSRWGFSNKDVEVYRDEDLNGEAKWCIDWQNGEVHEISGVCVCLDICLHQFIQGEIIEAEHSVREVDGD